MDLEQCNNNFTFAVMGDSRGKSTEQINRPAFGTLLKNLNKYHKPIFLLFAGDMINGRWASSFDPTTENMIIELTKWTEIVMKHFPDKNAENFLFPAIGNHDFSNAQYPPESERAFNVVFNYLPSMLPEYGKTVYYFDFGNARFITLNALLQNFGNDQILLGVLPIQRQWLENVLSSSKKLHNFVMLHYPPYPAQINEGLDQFQRVDLWKIIDKYNVTAVYTGHEHFYGRRIITNALAPNDEDSVNPTFYNTIPQYILGGAGAPLEAQYDNIQNFATAPLGEYSYMVVNINNTKVASTVYDINESIIDSFEYDSSKATNLWKS